MLEAAFQAAKAGKPAAGSVTPVSDAQVRGILGQLDAQGRWVSTYAGGMLVGQPKFPNGMKFIASEVFNRNLETLADYIASGTKK